MSRFVTSPHMDVALTPVEQDAAIKQAKKDLRGEDFEAIAFSGMSGAIFAPVLARLMKKNLILVRKPREDTHSGYTVEGDFECIRYIIVDDLISSGATVLRIYKEILRTRKLGMPPLCVGVYQYLKHNRMWRKNFFLDEDCESLCDNITSIAKTPLELNYRQLIRKWAERRGLSPNQEESRQWVAVENPVASVALPSQPEIQEHGDHEGPRPYSTYALPPGSDLKAFLPGCPTVRHVRIWSGDQGK